MRVLALRGRNLASLAGDFAVDFETEPLASAGLFAISGPTGAGKSTLLDALCLALYHQTPRLGGARSKVPDVGGESIEASNPRTLLRRGTGEGFAEVDFVGRDGVTYRARWEVRRARGRANGALQAATAQLSRRDDGTLIASQLSEAKAEIEARVGLSFEQFSRSVLLAQNQFAGFLQAVDAERATLLETLTGSEVFTALSIAAYRRAEEERRALEDLELQLSRDTPWADDERAAAEAAREEARGLSAQLEAQQAELERQQRWHQELSRARRASADAEQRRQDTARRVAEAAGRQAELVLVEAVQDARALVAEAERLAHEAARQRAAGERAQRELAAALARQQQVATERQAAEAAQRAARARREELTPELDQARRLEARLAEREPEAREAERQRADAEHQALAATAALAAAAAGHQRLADQLAEVSARLGAAVAATEPTRREAQAALAEHAEGLRRVLVPGEPCPVCGATEHPYAPAGGEVRELVAAVLPGLRALEAQLPGLRSGQEQAARDAERARDTAERAHQGVAALRQERAALLAGWPAGRPAAEVAAELEAGVRTTEARREELRQHAEGSLQDHARAAQAAESAALAGAEAERGQHEAAAALGRWLGAFHPPAPLPAPLDPARLTQLLAHPASWLTAERSALAKLDTALTEAATLAAERRQRADELAAQALTDEPAPAVAGALAATQESLREAREELTRREVEIAQDHHRRQRKQQLDAQLGARRQSAAKWRQLQDLIGSATGAKFRNYAQQLTLDVLLAYANAHLEELARRYRLERLPESLALLVVDQDMGDERRSVHSLSGGETFLVSLALALALASLSAQRVRVESLFIDEGFGSLDAETLGIALDALDRLQSQGRKVGVISHVAEMTERIGVRIEVERQSGGRSHLTISGL